MKASSLFSLILLAVAIVLAVLWYRDHSRLTDLTLAAAKWQKIDSLENRFDERATTWPKQAAEGGTTINVAVAKRYIANYQRTALRMEDNATNLTNSIWVDAASLSSMMKTIIENNGDGIRVYYSRYPVLKTDPDPRRADGGALDNHNSIVIFTTKPAARSAALHEDVFYGTKPTATPPASGAPTVRSLSLTQSSGQAYNYNGTCPPNTCDTGQ